MISHNHPIKIQYHFSIAILLPFPYNKIIKFKENIAYAKKTAHWH